MNSLNLKMDALVQMIFLFVFSGEPAVKIFRGVWLASFPRCFSEPVWDESRDAFEKKMRPHVVVIRPKSWRLFVDCTSFSWKLLKYSFLFLQNVGEIPQPRILTIREDGLRCPEKNPHSVDQLDPLIREDRFGEILDDRNILPILHVGSMWNPNSLAKKSCWKMARPKTGPQKTSTTLPNQKKTKKTTSNGDSEVCGCPFAAEFWEIAEARDQFLSTKVLEKPPFRYGRFFTSKDRFFIEAGEKFAQTMRLCFITKRARRRLGEDLAS